MGIETMSATQAVNQLINQKVFLAKQTIYRALFRVGEECINYAKIHGSYEDQTGNLRSSIGYAVIDDGKVISSNGFVQVKQGAEGVTTGKEFLTEIIALYDTGINLIVVAGMNYAAYVEARKYDVISGAELEADKITPVLLRQLGFKVAA